MLEHLELTAAATAVHESVARLLAEKGPRTADLGGNSTTGEVGAAVAERILSSIGRA
jgi:tartrate dehydrogenase/decarboxylase/D-malate dehydrogenase